MKMRRLIAACSAAALLFLAGCTSPLEGEYISVTPHESAAESAAPEVPVLSADSYDEIVEALLEIISGGDSYGIIRISGYSGDVEADVNEACMYVGTSTALGAYAVSYVSASVSRIISYYDAQITISYRKTPLEVKSIIPVSSLQQLEGELSYLMGIYRREEAVLLELPEVTVGEVTELVDTLYREDPTLGVMPPVVTASLYPETGESRVLETYYEYPYNTARLKDMTEKQASAVEELADAAHGLDNGQALFAWCSTLAETVEFDLQGEREGNLTAQSRPNLAYGALIDGKATGKGFALALMALCKSRNIPCKLVEGRRDSVDHCWLMVRLETEWYHVDASAFTDSPQNAFLVNDAAMEPHYLWDAVSLPVCDGHLNYYDFAGGTEEPDALSDGEPAEEADEETPEEVPEDEVPATDPTDETEPAAEGVEEP